MDTIKFAKPRAFHIDAGWYDAYWLEQTRSNPTCRIAQVLAPVFINLGRLAVYLTCVRRALAVRPATSSSRTNGCEVKGARQLRCCYYPASRVRHAREQKRC